MSLKNSFAHKSKIAQILANLTITHITANHTNTHVIENLTITYILGNLTVHHVHQTLRHAHILVDLTKKYMYSCPCKLQLVMSLLITQLFISLLNSFDHILVNLK